jgi:hypothetical protein
MSTQEPARPQAQLPEAESHARQLAGEALASGDPTGWFERLYAAAEAGQAAVPWDRGAPHPLLVDWASSARLDGTWARAVVVGCGLGHDAQYEDPDDGPPWALTRAEIDAFAGTGLEAVRIEEFRGEGPPATHRWRARFSRR